MRRATALSFFTLGYMAMAALDASVAAVPSLAAFVAGGWALVQPVLAPEN